MDFWSPQKLLFWVLFSMAGALHSADHSLFNLKKNPQKYKPKQTVGNGFKCSYKNLAGKIFGMPLCIGFSFWFLALFPMVQVFSVSFCHRINKSLQPKTFQNLKHFLCNQTGHPASKSILVYHMWWVWGEVPVSLILAQFRSSLNRRYVQNSEMHGHYSEIKRNWLS